MNYLKLLFIASLILHQPSFAQPLSIGDHMPHLQLNNILNYDSTSVNTSRFKGKLLLLDFGATTCIPCLKAMPLLDSLQKQFAGKMQVFMVTAESKQKVQQFLQKNKIAKQSSLPVITGDTLLSAYFPHTALPHEVWINADGIIVAITDHQYLTVSNIEQVLQKQRISWPVKSDAISSVNAGMIDPCLELKQLLYYSSFRNYLPGYKTKGVEKKDTATGTFSIRCINFTIPDLYKMILGIRPGGFYPKQIKADSSLRVRLFYASAYGYKLDWEQKNKYCYEVCLPMARSLHQLRREMKEELDIYLGVISLFEKRLLDCLVLQRMEGAAPPAGKKKKDQLSVKTIMNSFNFNDSLPLLLNETGFSDLELNRFFISISENEIKNLLALSQALEIAGFKISNEKRAVDILEFRLSPENQ